MNIDEWVDVLKNNVGSSDFKLIAIEYLREHFGCVVDYKDGPGDGGVDAWVVLQLEPRVQCAAQFHAGKSVSWESKLLEDVEKLKTYRDTLESNDPARDHFGRLYFVCTQTPSPVQVEKVARQIRSDSKIVVNVFDARTIVSLALQNRTSLWHLIASRIPGHSPSPNPSLTVRDEARLAFSFFHGTPAKFRWNVTKSAVAAVLHQSRSGVERDKLQLDAAQALGLPQNSKIVHRSIDALEKENLLSIRGQTVTASADLVATSSAQLAEATRDKEALRAECEKIVEPLVPVGTHHRKEVASRAVATIFEDLGLLVANPIAEHILYSTSPALNPTSKYERQSFKRWKTVATRFEQELGLPSSGHAVLKSVVEKISKSPFARNLAAAELFFALTEHEVPELEQALRTRLQTVVLDTSIALPMLCALFDKPVPSWTTSSTAHDLYHALQSRGARCVLPSPYLEEIAVHLINAQSFSDSVETQWDLSRSKNYFVAHFCAAHQSETDPKPTAQEFREFLSDFAPLDRLKCLSREEERARIEQSIRDILSRYDLAIEPFDQVATPLPNEPRRSETLLSHDRAVVAKLTKSRTNSGNQWLVCSADSWLRQTLNEREIVAIDSVGLIDLLELIRPSASPRALQSPIELAALISEQELELAAPVQDEIARIEKSALLDRELLRKANQFRAEWLGRRSHEDSLSESWIRFRDTGTIDPTP